MYKHCHEVGIAGFHCHWQCTFNFFYWGVIDLQCCVFWHCCVYFCCTAKWFCYIYGHILFIVLSTMFYPWMWTEFPVLCSRSLLLIHLCITVCICQPQTPHSSIPLPSHWQPQVCALLIVYFNASKGSHKVIPATSQWNDFVQIAGEEWKTNVRMWQGKKKIARSISSYLPHFLLTQRMFISTYGGV